MIDPFSQMKREYLTIIPRARMVKNNENEKNLVGDQYLKVNC